MGKTYHKQSHRYDDDTPSGRSGKHAKHSNGKKTGGMRTLNSYVEDYNGGEYEFDDEYESDDDTKHKIFTQR